MADFSVLNGYSVKDATARKQLEEIRTYVTPQMFGAIGDGITDDYESFKLACDYINERGGKLVIPVGTYAISKGLVFDKGVQIEGECSEKVVIQALSNFTPVNNSIISFYHENDHCDNISLKNVTILGNGDNTACLSVYSGYDYAEFINLHIRGVGSSSDGIRFLPNPDIADTDRVSQGLYVVNVIVYMDKADCAGNGFYIESVQESSFINTKVFSQMEYPETITTKSVGYRIVDSRGLTFKNMSCGNQDNTIYPVIVETLHRESAGIFLEDVTFESSANFLKTIGTETYPITSLVMVNVRDEGSGSSTPAVILNHTRKSIVVIPIGNISDNNGVSNITFVLGMFKANTSRGFDFFDFADNTTPTLHLTYPWGASNTALEIMVNINGTVTQRTIAVGEPDSAGTGYRTLRVLN